VLSPGLAPLLRKRPASFQNALPTIARIDGFSERGQEFIDIDSVVRGVQSASISASSLSDLTPFDIRGRIATSIRTTSGRHMPNFRPTDRPTGFLMPPSVDEWLPQRHLARFVVEVVDGLDLSAMQELSRFGFGFLPSGGAAEPPGVWLRHRGIFQPQTGTRHLRFGRLPLHRRERPSRPRHLPPPLSQGDRGVVRQVLLLARETGVLKMGD
jgi:hypothetical protein